MSLAGAVARLAVSLIALEAIQAWRRWRSAPVRVPQAEREALQVWDRQRRQRRLRVVQGGRL